MHMLCSEALSLNAACSVELTWLGEQVERTFFEKSPSYPLDWSPGGMVGILVVLLEKISGRSKYGWAFWR